MKIVSSMVNGHPQWFLRTERGDYSGHGLKRSLGLDLNPGDLTLAMAMTKGFLETLKEAETRVLQQGVEPDASHLTLLAPVPRPGKIICVGLNYRPHVAESQMDVPKTPVLFNKYQNAVVGPNTVVSAPSDATQLDYEAELVVVIGKSASKVSEDAALDYVFGYLNGNDLSDRGLQFRQSQWLLGKTADGFAPMGPYLVTKEEISDPGVLDISCKRNGVEVQRANTREMIFSVPFLIHYISHYISLSPGDVIFTGTPEGVILGQPEDKRRWLEPGERLEVTVTGLGSLETVIGPAR